MKNKNEKSREVRDCEVTDMGRNMVPVNSVEYSPNMTPKNTSDYGRSMCPCMGLH
jgi:hypothetical protein